MNNKKLTILIITGISILFVIYLIVAFIRLSNKNNQINQLETDINKLKRKIKEERKNKKSIERLNENFLQNAYFNREKSYFENYVRGLFNIYNIKISIYQSKLDNRNYSEMDVDFTTNVIIFFKLIKKIEEGDKIVVIKNLNIKKELFPNLKVTMKLGGYYK